MIFPFSRPHFMLQYIATMAKNFKNNNKKCPEKETVRWSDDLIEKLLESVKEFKAQEEYEGVDWESVKDKYENIRSLFIKNRRDENDNFIYHLACKIYISLPKQ